MERGADLKNHCLFNGKNHTPAGSNCMQNMACVNVPFYNMLMWFALAVNEN